MKQRSDKNENSSGTAAAAFGIFGCFGMPVVVVVVVVVVALILPVSIPNGSGFWVGATEPTIGTTGGKYHDHHALSRFLQIDSSQTRTHMRRCIGDVLGLGETRGYDKDDLRRDETRRNNKHNQRRSVRLVEDPADLDPLRFGPGTIPSSFGFDEATLSELSNCYVDKVLDYVETYFIDNQPIYNALCVEELCCRGVLAPDVGLFPSLSPSASALPTVATTRSKRSKKKRNKRKKAKKKKASNKRNNNNNRTTQPRGADKDDNQQSLEPLEQLLGVRFLQDTYELEDAIIVELCRPTQEPPEGHCTLQTRPESPTDVPRRTVPLL